MHNFTWFDSPLTLYLCFYDLMLPPNSNHNAKLIWGKRPIHNDSEVVPSALIARVYRYVKLKMISVLIPHYFYNNVKCSPLWWSFKMILCEHCRPLCSLRETFTTKIKGPRVVSCLPNNKSYIFFFANWLVIVTLPVIAWRPLPHLRTEFS